MLFHWAIAALILANLYLGWRMGIIDGLARFEMFQLHKSLGISVLLLSIGRLAWRLSHRPPAYPASMKHYEKWGASAVHWAFYAIMIVMPLTGWLVVSTTTMNLPTLLFKTVPWPHLPVHDLSAPLRKQIGGLSAGAHLALAFGTAMLVAMHVGAALKHHLVARDNVLGRMLPFGPRPQD
jgi:cytochrome b561